MSHDGAQEEQRSREDRLVRGLRQLAIDPQEAVPADLPARVMARAAAGPQPRAWRWGWLHLGDSPWTLPVLTTGLVLSLVCNIWLGARLVGPGGSAGSNGRVRLAFVDTVRELELRRLLLSLRATIIQGPSPKGVYLVQVPLARLRLRGAEEPITADPLHVLLEELQAHPAIRLAEPVSPSN